MAKKTLSLQLAKPDIVDFDQVLSDTAREKFGHPATRIVENPDFAEGAKLFVFVGDDVTPVWLRDVRQAFPVRGQIQNSSSCAVLAFKAGGRMFASTFAHGWMYLDEENIEGDFGLRVALNALDEKKLKRLERANLGDALRGISQSPFQREFSSFGLDDSLDLVRRLSGRARRDASADALSGSRSLKVSGDFEVNDLPRIAEEALQFYTSLDYRNSSFRIVDLVNPITDARLISSLDDQAVISIKGGRDDFELGLPINYSDDGVTYRFAGPGLRGAYPDLLLRHYIDALGDRIGECDARMLKEHKVLATLDDDTPPQKWSVRSALVGSLTYDQGRYAINEGEWYRIDEAFKNSIEDNFQELIEGWDE